MKRSRLLRSGMPTIPGATRGEGIHEAFVVSGSVAQRVVIAQVGALVSLIVGSGVATAVLLDGRFDVDDVGALALLAAAIVASVALRRGSLPLPMMDAVTVATDVALAAAGIQGGPAVRIVLPAIYVSIGTSVCLVRPMNRALPHMIGLSLSYGAVVVFGSHIEAPLTHWLAVVVSIAVSGTFAQWLVRQVVEYATAEREARLGIERATVELAAQNEARSVFLSKMSHELRTPLNSIVGFSDLLQDELDGRLDAVQRELVADIADSGRDLLALVDDLLDLSKVGEGEVALRLADVDLCEVARTVERLLWDRAHEAGVSLRVRSATRHLHLRADPLRVRQILWNVVGNAIKYSPRGEVVDVVVSEHDGWATTVVSDRGPGIDPAERERIFELYQQGTAAAPGSGIGLSLCRRLSEAHDGRLVAGAAAHGGSTFTLELPVRGPAADRGDQDADGGAAVPSLGELDKAILIPGSQANRLAIARVGRHVARATAAMLPVFALITPGDVAARVGVAALGFVALFFAWAIGRIASSDDRGFSSGMMDAWAIGGFAVIALGVTVLGSVQDVLVFCFGWPLLTAASLASVRSLVGQAAAVLVFYAVALAVAGVPNAPQHWLAVSAIVSTNGIVVGWVAGRLRESVVGLYEARLVAESAQREVVAVAAHKRDFLASTSHELLTPLNAVLGASAFLAHDGRSLTPQQLAHVADIHESGEALLNLLSDMLDFAKLESGRLPSLPSETEVGPLVDRALATVRPAADARRITLLAEVDDLLPVICVDPEHLERAVGILLANGLKYTAPGGRVEVIARRSESSVLLSVRDTGVGIGEHQLARVFEPFHQGVRRSPSGWDGGSGLGLALARGLLGLEGGEIRVESTPDVGSTFTIVIPLATEVAR